MRPEVRSYEDLRGKPLAVDAAESGFVTPLRLLLREHGLAEAGRDFSLVEVGATQHRIDAIRDGRCFGGMIGSGRSHELEAEGCRLYTHYASTAATRRDWAAQNADLLVRYLRAYLRSLRQIEAGANPSGGQPTAPPFEWEGIRR